MDKTRAKRIAAELKGQTVGAWTVGKYLGSGFSSVVIEAEKDGQPAAIKIIDPEFVSRAGEKRQLIRIDRERELIGHDHPYLVKIFDGGKCERTKFLYVVMERLHPRTLGQEKAKLSNDDIARYIGQLASAAQYLETRHMCHRDIKPDNTSLSQDGTIVKLLDLGVVLLTDDSAQSAGTGEKFIGTARYSPPELLYGNDEERDDCWRAITFYQLGATLFDLITKDVLFGDVREPQAVLYQTVKEKRPVINAPGIDRWMIDLTRRCLHKDWRIRQAIVKWEDFDGPPDSTDTAEIVRKRINEHLSVISSVTDSESETTARPTRRALKEASGSISAALRTMLQDGGVFPPFILQTKTTTNAVSLRLETGPAKSHGLEGKLAIYFECTLVEGTTKMISVSSGAAMNAGDSINGLELRHILIGEIEDPVTIEILDVYVHKVFEQSLVTGSLSHGIQIIHI